MRIELQQREDVIQEETDHISSMTITVKELKDVKDLSTLFGQNISELNFTKGNQLALSKVTISSDINGFVTDPNGVNISFVNINR